MQIAHQGTESMTSFDILFKNTHAHNTHRIFITQDVPAAKTGQLQPCCVSATDMNDV